MSLVENIVVIWMVPVLMQIILPLVLLVVFGLIHFIAELFQPLSLKRAAKKHQDRLEGAPLDGDIAGELKTVRRTFGW